jgi:hypothetical protein
MTPRKATASRSRRPSPLAVTGAFRSFVLDQLEDLGNVVPRAMFGGVGLYHRDVFFGIRHPQKPTTSAVVTCGTTRAIRRDVPEIVITTVYTWPVGSNAP